MLRINIFRNTIQRCVGSGQKGIISYWFEQSYPNYQWKEWAVNSSCKNIHIKWLNYEVERGYYDFVTIWVNNETEWEFSGNSLPHDIHFEGGAFLVEFSSDARIGGQGFIMHWQCAHKGKGIPFYTDFYINLFSKFGVKKTKFLV